jgi:hypothetical protein
MSRSDTISNIMVSLKDMLEQLSTKELEMVEDFIVNECDESYVDDNGNPPNLFRMTILDSED